MARLQASRRRGDEAPTFWSGFLLEDGCETPERFAGGANLLKLPSVWFFFVLFFAHLNFVSYFLWCFCISSSSSVCPVQSLAFKLHVNRAVLSPHAGPSASADAVVSASFAVDFIILAKFYAGSCRSFVFAGFVSTLSDVWNGPSRNAVREEEKEEEEGVEKKRQGEEKIKGQKHFQWFN